ncbi:MAG: hypothetical protein QNJ45_15510 [Ardenticatenaceae bacterium]|nr:hypothetical protein [Ardenticatenaceae bacterium]
MKNLTRWTLILATLWLFVVGCASDVVSRVDARVWYGQPANTEITDDQSKPLSPGDGVRTDVNGQARIQIKGCSSIYLYQQSGLQASACARSGGGTCLINGMSAHNHQCSQEVDVSSGTDTAIIRPLGTWYALGYQPEPEVTLIVVLDGKVEVDPVIDIATGSTGRTFDLGTEEFAFTMPDPPRPIAGLPPRTPLPLTDLPAVARDLGLDIYFPQLEFQASVDGVLPAGGLIPAGNQDDFDEDEFDEGPQGLILRLGGPDGDSPTFREAYFAAAPWQDIASEISGNPEYQVLFDLGRQGVEPAAQFEYNPDRASAMLGRLNYRTITLIVPVEDELAMQIVESYIPYLLELDIDPALNFYEGSNGEEVAAKNLESGNAIIWVQTIE